MKSCATYFLQKVANLLGECCKIQARSQKGVKKFKAVRQSWNIS